MTRVTLCTDTKQLPRKKTQNNTPECRRPRASVWIQRTTKEHVNICCRVLGFEVQCFSQVSWKRSLVDGFSFLFPLSEEIGENVHHKWAPQIPQDVVEPTTTFLRRCKDAVLPSYVLTICSIANSSGGRYTAVGNSNECRNSATSDLTIQVRPMRDLCATFARLSLRVSKALQLAWKEAQHNYLTHHGLQAGFQSKVAHSHFHLHVPASASKLDFVSKSLKECHAFCAQRRCV